MFDIIALAQQSGGLLPEPQSTGKRHQLPVLCYERQSFVSFTTCSHAWLQRGILWASGANRGLLNHISHLWRSQKSTEWPWRRDGAAVKYGRGQVLSLARLVTSILLAKKDGEEPSVTSQERRRGVSNVRHQAKFPLTQFKGENRESGTVTTEK